ncbi:MAG: hypothetical protein WC528_01740 [Patescibacteria group bacterium]
MKKYIILGLIVIVVVAGLLALFWFYPGIFPFGQNKNSASQNTNLTANTNASVNQNTNTPAVNLNISLKTGSIQVNKAVTYRNIEFKVLTADKSSVFEKMEAGSGQTLVGLYLERITGGNIVDISSWLRTEIKLKNSQGREFSLFGYNLPGGSAPSYSASYLVFETGQKDSGFSLNFGTGEAFQTIDLGF